MRFLSVCVFLQGYQLHIVSHTVWTVSITALHIGIFPFFNKTNALDTLLLFLTEFLIDNLLGSVVLFGS